MDDVAHDIDFVYAHFIISTNFLTATPNPSLTTSKTVPFLPWGILKIHSYET